MINDKNYEHADAVLYWGLESLNLTIEHVGYYKGALSENMVEVNNMITSMLEQSLPSWLTWLI